MYPLRAQARANRGILYVDEVNLLDDGLVDVVLDSAASGLNTVEREGVSIIHPAKFIMLGSGNPQVSCALLLHMFCCAVLCCAVLCCAVLCCGDLTNHTGHPAGRHAGCLCHCNGHGVTKLVVCAGCCLA